VNLRRTQYVFKALAHESVPGAFLCVGDQTGKTAGSVYDLLRLGLVKGGDE
jgi:hypothetical protein